MYKQKQWNIFFLTFCWSSLSQFSRFSNPQTRSCSMAAERVWAPDAQSLPQGKPRNDTCSLPSTSDPSLLPSLPLLSFLSPNSQKSNLYPGLFPFLSVLLKTFNVTNCLSERVRACVRRWRLVCRRAIKSVCTCTFCVRVLEVYTFPSLFPLFPWKGWNHSVRQYGNVDWNAGFGKMGKLLTRCQQTPASRWRVCTRGGEGEVFCCPCPLYCKILNTGVCVCARALCLAWWNVAAMFPWTRSGTSSYLGSKSHVHAHTRAFDFIFIWARAVKTPIQFRFVQIWLLERDFCEFVL